MNKAILVGRLTKDPELKSTPSGVNVATFTIAVPRKYKKDETDFINCVAWRQTAEFVSMWFKKGKWIAVDGSIQTRVWEDQNQKKNYITEVIVNDAYFVGDKNSNTKDDMDAPTHQANTVAPTAESIGGNGFFDLPGIEDDEDLPF